MKFIGNILTDNTFTDNVLYNVASDVNGLIDGIPTLIIGWEKTKELYPDASIISFNVVGDVYWTYGKYERRDKYEANVKKFMDITFKKFVDSLDYVFYDVISSGNSKFESFIESLLDDKLKTGYIFGDMLYVYYDGSKKVVGVSLRDCDYIDEALKKRIFSALYKSQSVKMLKNNEEIPKEIRYKVKNMTYILPYLFS